MINHRQIHKTPQSWKKRPHYKLPTPSPQRLARPPGAHYHHHFSASPAT
ncbi:hypothetical protein HMPREF9080_01347 [Cardiobacterium valvarum F0432]|uniref:Uncharacterized protein n=1 Tax=Cardiobacterium valvarum F0432 TaxID=797473 RepID=G9ZF06_9GAMM|nr:hypothetical protein HMPREF9080_01347 [Cardiobacterium valvarum F0432]